MCKRWLVRCLIGPVLLFGFAPVCQAFHRYRPVSVLARDAETRKPIPDATVQIAYPFSRPSSAPQNSSAKTGTDGVAHLQAAPCGDGSIVVEAAANGYISEEKYLSDEQVEAIKPAHLFEAVERRPVTVVLEMYAAPRPVVELVVQNGHRGLIRAEVQIQEMSPSQPGQRWFSYQVPLSGEVQVTGPAVLKRAFPTEFRARYADGTPLSGEAKDSEIGFWWLKEEGTFDYFVVGTKSEFDALHHFSAREDTGGNRPAGGGKGQGRGGAVAGGSGDLLPRLQDQDTTDIVFRYSTERVLVGN